MFVNICFLYLKLSIKVYYVISLFDHELQITHLHVYLLFSVRLLLNITDINQTTTTTSWSEHNPIIPDLELWVNTHLTHFNQYVLKLVKLCFATIYRVLPSSS